MCAGIQRVALEVLNQARHAFIRWCDEVHACHLGQGLSPDSYILHHCRHTLLFIITEEHKLTLVLRASPEGIDLLCNYRKCFTQAVNSFLWQGRNVRISRVEAVQGMKIVQSMAGESRQKAYMTRHNPRSLRSCRRLTSLGLLWYPLLEHSILCPSHSPALHPAVAFADRTLSNCTKSCIASMPYHFPNVC